MEEAHQLTQNSCRRARWADGSKKKATQHTKTYQLKVQQDDLVFTSFPAHVVSVTIMSKADHLLSREDELMASTRTATAGQLTPPCHETANQTN